MIDGLWIMLRIRFLSLALCLSVGSVFASSKNLPDKWVELISLGSHLNWSKVYKIPPERPGNFMHCTMYTFIPQEGSAVIEDPVEKYQDLLCKFLSDVCQGLPQGAEHPLLTTNDSHFASWLKTVCAPFEMGFVVDKLYEKVLQNPEMREGFVTKLSQAFAGSNPDVWRRRVVNTLNDCNYASWQRNVWRGYMASLAAGALGIYSSWRVAKFFKSPDLDESIMLVWLLHAQGRGWSQMNNFESDALLKEVESAYCGQEKEPLFNYIKNFKETLSYNASSDSLDCMVGGEKWQIPSLKRVLPEVKAKALALLERLWLERQHSLNKKRLTHFIVGAVGAAALAVGSLIYRHKTRPELVKCA